jgi:hypothetical protein
MDHEQINSLELISTSIGSGWPLEVESRSSTQTKLESSSNPSTSFRFVLSLSRLRRLLQLEVMPPDLVTKLALMTKRLRGGLIATDSEVNLVPIRDVPLRIEPISSRVMPTCEAICSADAIEIQLSQRASLRDRISFEALRIDWPIDTATVEQLGKKTQMLQRIAMSPIPIGLSLPITVGPEMVAKNYGWLKSLPLQFINLRMPLACLPPDHLARDHFQTQPQAIASAFRRLLDDSEKAGVAIGVDYPWIDGYHAAATCVAGASFVSIDGYLAQRAPTSKPTGRGTDSLTLGFQMGDKSVESLIEQSSQLRRVQSEWDVANDLELFARQFASVLDFSL